MLLYYSYFLCLVFFSYVYSFEYKKKYSYIGTALLFFISIYIAGFRDVNIVDTDFFVYKNNYYGLNNATMDIGYDWLQSLFRYFNLEFNIFLIFFIAIALLTKIIAFRIISKYWILLFIFYLLGLVLTKEMATLRMSLAFSFVIYSVHFIIEKKFIKYIIILLLGSLFHKSTILLIPFYFINRLNLNIMKVTLFLIVAIIIDKSGFIENIIKSILDIKAVGGTYIWIKLKTFSNYEDGTTVGLLIPVVIKKITIVIIGLYTLNKYKSTNEFKNINIFFNYMFVGIFILFLFGDSILWAAGSRISTYFSVFELVVLAYFVLSFKNNLNKFIAFGFSILYVGSKFIMQILKYQDLYIPYHTILSKWI
jgi:transmembrane protein EpsG